MSWRSSYNFHELSPVEEQGIWRGIWLEEAHHSTAIEGNTLVLNQIEILLAEGRADWVCGRGLQPGAWSDGDLISLAEIRHIHVLAMTLVWNVAPYPVATAREGRGSFREHDIAPFPGRYAAAAMDERAGADARLDP